MFFALPLRRRAFAVNAAPLRFKFSVLNPAVWSRMVAFNGGNTWQSK